MPDSALPLQERSAVLDQLEARPDAEWKVTGCYTFKNEVKVFGSPWFDDVYLATGEQVG
jgi:hypothetical protein